MNLHGVVTGTWDLPGAVAPLQIATGTGHDLWVTDASAEHGLPPVDTARRSVAPGRHTSTAVAPRGSRRSIQRVTACRRGRTDGSAGTGPTPPASACDRRSCRHPWPTRRGRSTSRTPGRWRKPRTVGRHPATASHRPNRCRLPAGHRRPSRVATSISRTVPSVPELTSVLPEDVHARSRTQPADASTREPVSAPVAAFQNRTSPVPPPVASTVPSGLKATASGRPYPSSTFTVYSGVWPPGANTAATPALRGGPMGDRERVRHRVERDVEDLSLELQGASDGCARPRIPRPYGSVVVPGDELGRVRRERDRPGNVGPPGVTGIVRVDLVGPRCAIGSRPLERAAGRIHKLP